MMNDSDEFPNHDEFPINGIPENAPEELKNLATNISEILTPIKKIRGTEYVNHLMLMMSIHSQVRELEDIACETTQMVYRMGEEYCKDSANLENILQGAQSRHQMTHLYSDVINKHLNMLTVFIESAPRYEGFSKDLKVLLNRIETDWKSKGH